MAKEKGINSIALITAVIIVYIVGIGTGYYLLQQQKPVTSLVTLPSKTYTATSNIVAVKQQGQAGVISKGVVEIRDGQGRVLFNTNPFVETDTQQSIETAAGVAETITGKSLKDKDIIYSVEDANTQLIGGPSAGAAFTVATIAAMQEKKVRADIVMTGTINADGSIGQIGGVIEKAAAAEENHMALFLVPKGQSTLSYYEQQVKEERRGSFIIRRINYIPKTLNLNDYAKEQGWKVEIKEVKDIKEALQYALA
ncbi:MAG: S16 family serine protease [Candidatus Diapherotrites archaeon]